MIAKDLENNPTYWRKKYENLKYHYEQENKELKEALEEIKTQHLKVWTIANNALSKL